MSLYDDINNYANNARIQMLAKFAELYPGGKIGKFIGFTSSGKRIFEINGKQVIAKSASNTAIPEYFSVVIDEAASAEWQKKKKKPAAKPQAKKKPAGARQSRPKPGRVHIFEDSATTTPYLVYARYNDIVWKNERLRGSITGNGSASEAYSVPDPPTLRPYNNDFVFGCHAYAEAVAFTGYSSSARAVSNGAVCSSTDNDAITGILDYYSTTTTFSESISLELEFTTTLYCEGVAATTIVAHPAEYVFYFVSEDDEFQVNINEIMGIGGGSPSVPRIVYAEHAYSYANENAILSTFLVNVLEDAGAYMSFTERELPDEYQHVYGEGFPVTGIMQAYVVHTRKEYDSEQIESKIIKIPTRDTVDDLWSRSMFSASQVGAGVQVGIIFRTSLASFFAYDFSQAFAQSFEDHWWYKMYSALGNVNQDWWRYEANFDELAYLDIISLSSTSIVSGFLPNMLPQVHTYSTADAAQNREGAVRIVQMELYEETENPFTIFNDPAEVVGVLGRSEAYTGTMASKVYQYIPYPDFYEEFGVEFETTVNLNFGLTILNRGGDAFIKSTSVIDFDYSPDVPRALKCWAPNFPISLPQLPIEDNATFAVFDPLVDEAMETVGYASLIYRG